MLGNVAFIGGIHGVGKSTICRKICEELRLEYLSASDLLQWKEINVDEKNKKVEDVNSTQDRLVMGLKNRVTKNFSYLLDGHYCLINSNNEIVNVPLNTYEQISPIWLGIFLGNITEIKCRIEKRDNKKYDYKLLSLMQNNELEYAKKLSNYFGVELNIATENDYSDLLVSLFKIFSNK